MKRLIIIILALAVSVPVSLFASYATAATLPSTPPPTVAVMVNSQTGPLTVDAGQTVQITWTSTNAYSCTLSGNGSTIVSSLPMGGYSVTPTTETTYSVACYGVSGMNSSTVKVYVVQAPVTVAAIAPAPPSPLVTVNTSTRTTSIGGRVTISWNSYYNTNACVLSSTPVNPGWSGTRGISGSVDVVVTENSIFFVQCSTAGGVLSNKSSIGVNTTTAPGVALVANPNTVVSGGAAILTWSISGNISSCSTAGGWTGPRFLGDIAGSESTGPLSTGKTFSLTCTGAGGTFFANATVNVAQSSTPSTIPNTTQPSQPVPTIPAPTTPQVVRPNAPTGVTVSSACNSASPVTITWSPVPGATSYKVLVNGAFVQTAHTQTSFTYATIPGARYNVRATNSAGDSIDSATVINNPLAQCGTNVTPNPSTGSGGTPTVTPPRSMITVPVVQTPLPAVSCTQFQSSINIGVGSTDDTTGGDVTRLQQFLVSKGYLSITNQSNYGTFGPLTVSAVKSFQLRYSITTSGLVGPITKARITSLSCGVQTPSSTPSVSGGCADGAVYNTTSGAMCYVPPVTSTPTSPTLAVLYPNGGESLRFGTLYTIRWNSARRGEEAVYVVNDAGQKCLMGRVPANTAAAGMFSTNFIGNPCVTGIITFKPGEYQMVSRSYKIIIETSDITAGKLSDESNGYFGILDINNREASAPIRVPIPGGVGAPINTTPTSASTIKDLSVLGEPVMEIQYDAMRKPVALLVKGTIRFVAGDQDVRVLASNSLTASVVNSVYGQVATQVTQKNTLEALSGAPLTLGDGLSKTYVIPGGQIVIMQFQLSFDRNQVATGNYYTTLNSLRYTVGGQSNMATFASNKSSSVSLVNESTGTTGCTSGNRYNTYTGALCAQTSGAVSTPTTTTVPATNTTTNTTTGFTNTTTITPTNTTVSSESAVTGVPSISILTPRSGTTLRMGTVYQAAWLVNNNPGGAYSYNIRLYKGNAQIGIISTFSNTDRAASWVVPSNLAPGSDYRFFIVGGYGGRYVEAWSEPFTISTY